MGLKYKLADGKMKYSMECKVDSRIIIEKELRYNEGEKEIILIPNEERFIPSIMIIANVPNPTNFYSKAEKGEKDGVAHKLTFNTDKQLHDELIYEFQQIESILSFSTDNLKKIYWESPKEELIPETDEEKEKTSVLSLQWEKEYPSTPIILNEDRGCPAIAFDTKNFASFWIQSPICLSFSPDFELLDSLDKFKRMIKHREKYSSLVIPKAFFREGMSEYNSFRYINAFYNFYFIIEDFYGKGKKDSAVENELKNSQDFRSHVQWILGDIKTHRRHFENINNFLKQRNKNYDIEGIVYLLVKMRGQLHHYSGKSTQTKGTPFNHKDFESIAYLAMGISYRSILQKILEINTQIS
jgi:hypothetical protein